MNFIKAVFILFIGVVIFSACSNKKEPTAGFDCNTSGITYTNTIKSIMDANCNGCHNTQPPNLATYNNVKASIDQIIGCINHKAGFKAMPPTGTKISSSDIQKIECWKSKGMAE